MLTFKKIMSNKFILLGENDNVVVAISDVKKGETFELNGEKIVALDDIPFGHKMAIKDIKRGEYIIKYNEIIGIAKTDIKKGSHVHIHNIESLRGKKHE